MSIGPTARDTISYRTRRVITVSGVHQLQERLQPRDQLAGERGLQLALQVEQRRADPGEAGADRRDIEKLRLAELLHVNDEPGGPRSTVEAFQVLHPDVPIGSAGRARRHRERLGRQRVERIAAARREGQRDAASDRRVIVGVERNSHRTAGWLEGGLAMGYEKFIVDADFCGALHTYLRGIDLSDEQFALDGFHEVGPGKHFFGAQHTLRHYETAFWDSWTADNSSFEQWRDAGERRVEERAADKVAEMLAAYEPPPIDSAVDEALQEFVARRKAEMPDQWY